MRFGWIIVGVIALLWLGFLHLDRNEIRLELDEIKANVVEIGDRFDGLDQRYEVKEEAPSQESETPIGKTEENLDKAEDNIDKKIEMPYEQDDTNQNTDLMPSDNDIKAEEKEDQKEIKKENKKTTGDKEASLQQESVDAFKSVDTSMINPKVQEAFKLDIMTDAQESVVAFKLR